MTVLRHPKPHHCHPGYRVHVITAEEYESRRNSSDPLVRVCAMPPGTGVLVDLHLPSGAVWQCDDCDTIWVGFRPYINYLVNSWRKATRRELRRFRREGIIPDLSSGVRRNLDAARAEVERLDSSPPGVEYVPENGGDR